MIIRNKLLRHILSRGFLLILFTAMSLYTVSCDSGGDSSDSSDPFPDIEFRLDAVFPDLSFDRPLDIQNAGDGTDRLFVVEQKGVIHVIERDQAPGANTAQLKGVEARSGVFLDIENRVLFDESELGMLGLAFHPDYEDNGLFYVNYIADNPLRSVISQFSVSGGDPNAADPESELVLIELEQPHVFHNGGQLVFGPFDGYLYISLGDGGPAFGGDGKSQDLTNLFGSILRIDVDNPEDGLDYGIPQDNPFAGNTSGFREEIFAYGLRNPWRISFDSLTGVLWAADVGEADIEEIDIVENAKNYGWPIMEGSNCFDPPSGCDTSGLELPVWEYGHNLGRSIIGGIVYRSSELPELAGRYIYGDFVSGRIWALSFDGTTATGNTQLLKFSSSDSFIITSFGIDEHNELYITGFDGNIYQIAEETVITE